MLLETFVCKLPGGHVFSFLLGIYLRVELLGYMGVLCDSCSVVSDSLRPWFTYSMAPLSMEFSRQEYWEWVAIPFSRLGDLPNPGIEPRFPALQADSLPSEPPGKRKALERLYGN
ncbi:unnamed protein product [Rangifer tarandus platyrhynchus]|uniref:Uncharacterized protein n=2 Tax=Rangifer tarandus platyrhynchus TaxID=3082113 RepID=A0AC59YFK6_RANTA|nr:unnamed protein product [Rangifer tarandus platyrhynchus]